MRARQAVKPEGEGEGDPADPPTSRTRPPTGTRCRASAIFRSLPPVTPIKDRSALCDGQSLNLCRKSTITASSSFDFRPTCP